MGGAPASPRRGRRRGRLTRRGRRAPCRRRPLARRPRLPRAARSSPRCSSRSSAFPTAAPPSRACARAARSRRACALGTRSLLSTTAPCSSAAAWMGGARRPRLCLRRVRESAPPSPRAFRALPPRADRRRPPWLSFSRTKPTLRRRFGCLANRTRAEHASPAPGGGFCIRAALWRDGDLPPRTTPRPLLRPPPHSSADRGYPLQQTVTFLFA